MKRLRVIVTSAFLSASGEYIYVHKIKNFRRVHVPKVKTLVSENIKLVRKIWEIE